MTILRVRPEEDRHAADWGAGARRCAIGAAGIGIKQREGDRLSPLGIWPLRRILYRADRMAAPRTHLPAIPIQKTDGWCDAPGDPNYNRMVRLPYGTSTEALWRDDSLYDALVVVGFNDAPVIQGAGSAIFVHVAARDYAPTMGCIALARDDLLEAVALLRPGDQLHIET